MKKTVRFCLIFAFPVVFAAVFVFAKIYSKTDDFDQAKDFPRDALIYIQFQDLPAVINLWKNSDISKKYFESANFAEFQSNHLALKLVERANEIYESLNIFPSLESLSNLSENRAALAVYDIGKMEIVFIAPLSEEKILASSLFKSSSNFEEITLDDESVVYSKEIEVDRGRQRQKVLFTNFRGRLIVATSEKYFLQTLDNIKGKTPRNRLFVETSFKELAEKTKPNLTTVWLDQQKLNDDWYFKHYWLMSGSENLKNLRSGMFDFEIQETKLIERRVFLTVENKFTNKIKAETANRIIGLVPENIPFYKIQAAQQAGVDESVSDIFFDARNNLDPVKIVRSKEAYYYNDWGKSDSYSYLGSDYDEQVNEIEEKISEDRPAAKQNNELSKLIGETNPTVSLTILAPKSLPPPLFFETRKALIVSLQNPGKLNYSKLEIALSKIARNLLTVNSSNADFVWKEFSVDGIAAKQLSMPSLGRKIFYALEKNELVFSNDEELLKEIFAKKESPAKFVETFNNFTVITLNDRRQVFDDVFNTLRIEENQSNADAKNDFFTGNIGSLLDVASNVGRIEIKQNSDGNFVFEEIAFVLKEKPE